MNYRESRDGAAIVCDDYEMMRIDETTPLGKSVLALNEPDGILCKVRLHKDNKTLWTHWAPLPVVPKGR